MVTEEQRKRMEENRAAALARIQAKADVRWMNPDKPLTAQDRCDLPKLQAAQMLNPGPLLSDSFPDYHLSHKQYMAEAERRFPASKKLRTNQGSWTLRACIHKDAIDINSNSRSFIKTDKIAPNTTPMNVIEVSLELSSFDEFTVSIPAHSVGRDVLSRLVSSVNPLHCKTFETGQSSPDTALFHINDYNSVLQILRSTPGIILKQIPQATLTVIQKISRVKSSHQQWTPFMPNHIPDLNVDELLEQMPSKLKAGLLPFQLEGVRYGLRRGGRCLIADDMGVGKTIQAIALASCYAHEGSILITCPASLRLMWAEELEHWLPSLLPSDVHLVFGRRNNLLEHVKTPKVVVISYTMLRRLRNSMLARKWAMLVVDESHNLRCTRQKVECEETTAVLDIARKVKRVVLLSGTPSLSRPFDIFHQVDCLRYARKK